MCDCSFVGTNDSFPAAKLNRMQLDTSCVRRCSSGTTEMRERHFDYCGEPSFVLDNFCLSSVTTFIARNKLPQNHSPSTAPIDTTNRQHGGQSGNRNRRLGEDTPREHPVLAVHPINNRSQSGMGEAISRHLASLDWKIALADIKPNDSLAADLGPSARFYHTDVASYSSQAATFSAVWRDFGRIDALVCAKKTISLETSSPGSTRLANHGILDCQ